MLKISAQQMAAFSEPLRRRFQDRMVEHMRVRAKTPLPAERLGERTCRLIELAEQHGIDEENDICRFLEQMIDRVPDALRNPEVVAILKSPRTPSAAKVAFIADLLGSKR